MNTLLLIFPKFKAFDNSNPPKPLAGGKVYTYAEGTTTPKITYKDNAGVTSNANPVILDANGEADIWLDGFYKIVLKDKNDVQLWSVDNVSSKEGSEKITTLVDAATIITDASLSNLFKVTLGGNRTLAAPTNPSAGQKVTWIFVQDATGSRTITLNSVFRIRSGHNLITLSTAANTTDYMTAVYNLEDVKWDIIEFVPTSVVSITTNKTADYTLTAVDLIGRTTFTDSGASSQINFTLPAGTANDSAHFLMINENGFKLSLTSENFKLLGETVSVINNLKRGSFGVKYVSPLWYVIPYDFVFYKGYIMGGNTGANTAVIEDLVFSTETSAAISATLDTAKGYGAGVNSVTKGYIMGGNTGSITAVIEDLVFSTETSVAISATLDTAKSYGAGVNSGSV